MAPQRSISAERSLARTEEFLTVRQVALRAQVCENTVHRWIARGLVGGVWRLGRAVRIHRLSAFPGDSA